MGDAKSRQRKKGGRHENGRVNIEISPVLGSGSGERWTAKRDYSILFSSHVSDFITTTIPSKNNNCTENICIGSS